MQEPSCTPDAEMAARPSSPPETQTVDPLGTDSPAEPKRPRLSDVALTIDPRPAKSSSYVRDLQQAREANFRKGSGILLEFWTNRDSSPNMKRLVQATQICSFLYHQGS